MNNSELLLYYFDQIYDTQAIKVFDDDHKIVLLYQDKDFTSATLEFVNAAVGSSYWKCTNPMLKAKIDAFDLASDRCKKYMGTSQYKINQIYTYKNSASTIIWQNIPNNALFEFLGLAFGEPSIINNNEEFISKYFTPINTNYHKASFKNGTVVVRFDDIAFEQCDLIVSFSAELFSFYEKKIVNLDNPMNTIIQTFEEMHNITYMNKYRNETGSYINVPKAVAYKFMQSITKEQKSDLALLLETKDKNEEYEIFYKKYFKNALSFRAETVLPDGVGLELSFTNSRYFEKCSMSFKFDGESAYKTNNVSKTKFYEKLHGIEYMAKYRNLYTSYWDVPKDVIFRVVKDLFNSKAKIENEEDEMTPGHKYIRPGAMPEDMLKLFNKRTWQFGTHKTFFKTEEDWLPNYKREDVGECVKVVVGMVYAAEVDEQGVYYFCYRVAVKGAEGFSMVKEIYYPSSIEPDTIKTELFGIVNKFPEVITQSYLREVGFKFVGI